MHQDTPRIRDWLVDEIRKAHGIDLSKHPEAAQPILAAAEKARQKLRISGSADIELLFGSADDPKNFKRTVTIAELKSWAANQDSSSARQ